MQTKEQTFQSNSIKCNTKKLQNFKKIKMAITTVFQPRRFNRTLKKNCPEKLFIFAPHPNLNLDTALFRD